MTPTPLFGYIQKKRSAFSSNILSLIENNNLITGEINVLELEFLYEIGRASEKGMDVYRNLKSSMGLELISISSEVILKALDIKWTRDVFDRITVAGAMTLGTNLITKDANILDNFDLAVW